MVFAGGTRPLFCLGRQKEKLLVSALYPFIQPETSSGKDTNSLQFRLVNLQRFIPGAKWGGKMSTPSVWFPLRRKTQGQSELRRDFATQAEAATASEQFLQHFVTGIDRYGGAKCALGLFLYLWRDVKPYRIKPTAKCLPISTLRAKYS